MISNARKILHNRYIKDNPERESSVREERRIAAMERVINAVRECHTHPGKQRTLNEGRDCYSGRIGHSHVVLDLSAWLKVEAEMVKLDKLVVTE